MEYRLSRYKYLDPMIKNIDLDIELLKFKGKPHAKLDILKYKLNYEKNILDEAINSLKKDKHKDLIKLFYIEGLSLIDIADKWGDSYSSVRSLKHRLLKKIELHLSKYYCIDESN